MANKPRTLYVIDAETDPFMVGRIPEPFIWGCYDGCSPVRYFDDVTQLLGFLSNQRCLVYAHNGGRFDYHLGFLRHLEPYSDVTIINGRLARFRIGDAEFRDSVNILPMQLKEFRKDDIDYGKLERGVRERHMPEIKRYLATDCEALFELVNAFRTEYGDSLTLAGAAMKTWRKMANITSISNQDSDFFDTMSPYYYGGRVQCFRHGIVSRAFNVLDINSAYPHAMLSDHPFSRDYDVTDHVPVPRSPEKVDPQAFYSCTAVAHGCFPYRDGAGSLRFPDDDQIRTYHITGWELRAALATDAVESLRITRRYTFPVIDNFRPYVMRFYKRKKTAKKGTTDYILAKFMMNALSGKFGANPDNYSSYGIVPIPHAEAAESDESLTIGRHTGGWCHAGNLGPWALLRSDLDSAEKYYYNVATVASITGYVRAKLWGSICDIRSAGGTPLYCDTDSLAYCGARGLLSESKELGDWSHEGNFDRACLAGKKLYGFRYTRASALAILDGGGKLPADSHGRHWKTASKGVSLSPTEIEQIARGEPVDYDSPHPVFSPFKGPRMMKRRIRATH